MEKYENESGQIGVIISGGFGAGWSTWNDDRDFFSMDKTLVEMKLRGAPETEVEKYCKNIKDDSPCMGGWSEAETSGVGRTAGNGAQGREGRI